MSIPMSVTLEVFHCNTVSHNTGEGTGGPLVNAPLSNQYLPPPEVVKPGNVNWERIPASFPYENRKDALSFKRLEMTGTFSFRKRVSSENLPTRL